MHLNQNPQLFSIIGGKRMLVQNVMILFVLLWKNMLHVIFWFCIKMFGNTSFRFERYIFDNHFIGLENILSVRRRTMAT